MKKQLLEIKKEIIVFGLRRAGNHAIINWILPQINGDFAYYNDVWPDEPYKGEPKQKRGDGSKIDMSLISFEDYNLQIFKSLLANKIYPKVHKRIVILIIRDPFNWYSSRLKSNMSQPAHYSGLNIRQLYLQYCREYQGKSNYLGEKKVLISYNRWKEDKDYRKSISNQLGLNFTDEALNKVTGEGGGSSFDGMRIKGQQLQTNKRYINYLNNTKFLSLFVNSEIFEFAEDEFEIPEELVFTKDKVNKGKTNKWDQIVLSIVPKLTRFLRQVFVKFRKK